MTAEQIRAKIEAMTGPLEVHEGVAPVAPDDPWSGKTVYVVKPADKKIVAVFPAFNWGIGASDISLDAAMERILANLMLPDCLRIEEGTAGLRSRN